MAKYQVVVGNVGTIYDGDLREAAMFHFTTAKGASIAHYGRWAGEPVTVFEDGEPVKEHHGDERG